MPLNGKESVLSRDRLAARTHVRVKQAWKDEYLFQAYELAKSGSTRKTIAHTLGIDPETLARWEVDIPSFKKALDLGWGLVGPDGNPVATFREYVYGRLPPKLQELWTEIMGVEPKKVNGKWQEPDESQLERVETMLSRQGLRARQSLFIHALVHTNFNASEASRLVRIDKTTFDRWKQDPDFLELMEEVEWHKGNFFEGAFVGLVQAGNPQAIVHAAKTFNRKRGYGDVQTVEHTGQLNVAHAMVDVDDLDLPLPVRKAMLDAMRKKRQADEEKALKAKGLALPEHVEDAEFTITEDDG